MKYILIFTPMKLICAILSLFVILSCHLANRQIEAQKLSRTHSHLNEILDHYKDDYKRAISPSDKKQLKEQYLYSLDNYLIDSLGRYIDSIRVNVDTVIQDGWMVMTQFHSKGIEFKYGMKFKDSMDSKTDSLYNFMINLKPGTETTVNFIYVGTSRVNDPDDKSLSTFRIFAYPSSLNF